MPWGLRRPGWRLAPFMVNYRVRDLDAMLSQLRAAGAQVDDRVEDLEYGRFGWATNSRNNPSLSPQIPALPKYNVIR